MDNTSHDFLPSTRLSAIRYSTPKSSSPLSSGSCSTESSASRRASTLKPCTFSSIEGGQRRQLFLYHEQVVRTLSGKDNAYSLAALRARASADAAEKAQRALEMIRRRENTLSTRLKQVENRFFRSVIFPSRTASEITSLRDRIKSISERQIEAKGHMRRLHRKAAADAARAERLRADANLLAASKSAGRNILKHSSPLLEEFSDDDDSEEWQDRLVNVTVTALDSLSAQEETRSLLQAAAKFLNEVKRCVADATLITSGEGDSDGDKNVRACTPRISKNYTLKMAAWKAREAGKRIERAVVLNDQLPLCEIVERNRGYLLNLSEISNVAILSTAGLTNLVGKISESVEVVEEALTKSIVMQDTVVARLQGDVMDSLTELEQTSVDFEHMRDGLRRVLDSR